LRGITIGDDALLAGERFVAAGDGVGAWTTREKGNAALWSRLVVHFWAREAERNEYGDEAGEEAEGAAAGEQRNPVRYLQRAYELTVKATASPNEWFGTTTACGALIADDGAADPKPVLYITQLGDSTIMVLRPRDREIIYKTKEQWHWFDCPRQLGTNSPDTPEENAVMDRVEIEEDDVVLAMTDGVCDNLWDHEVLQNVVDSMHRWENGEANVTVSDPEDKGYDDEMMYVAQELVKAARVIAEDPFAESPYMEKAIDEGLSMEGGERTSFSNCYVYANSCQEREMTLVSSLPNAKGERHEYHTLPLFRMISIIL
jgi:serine/threonine protein phosphatase PrpC